MAETAACATRGFGARPLLGKGFEHFGRFVSHDVLALGRELRVREHPRRQPLPAPIVGVGAAQARTDRQVSQHEAGGAAVLVELPFAGPHHVAGEIHFAQPLGLVAAHAGAQIVPFPRDARPRDPVQLRELLGD